MCRFSTRICVDYREGLRGLEYFQLGFGSSKTEIIEIVGFYHWTCGTGVTFVAVKL